MNDDQLKRLDTLRCQEKLTELELVELKELCKLQDLARFKELLGKDKLSRAEFYELENLTSRKEPGQLQEISFTNGAQIGGPIVLDPTRPVTHHIANFALTDIDPDLMRGPGVQNIEIVPGNLRNLLLDLKDDSEAERNYGCIAM